MTKVVYIVHAFHDSGMCEEQPTSLHEGMFLPTIEVSLPLFTITHTPHCKQ